MKLWIERLGSLKLTVVLLLVVGVVLAVGTIFESLRGAEAARAVYYAPWFFALEGLFGLNLLAALITRWPRNRFRIGFALTHASMLLILVGALMTVLFKVEGRMPIWEGQSTDVVFQGAKEGDLPPLRSTPTRVPSGRRCSAAASWSNRPPAPSSRASSR